MRIIFQTKNAKDAPPLEPFDPNTEYTISVSRADGKRMGYHEALAVVLTFTSDKTKKTRQQ